jgi:hypothetical protein
MVNGGAGAADLLQICRKAADGSFSWATIDLPPATGAAPSGSILMVISGACPSGYAEVSALNGKMVLGTLSANADVGTGGGADTITPAGSVSAPAFTGTLATLAHSGTAVSAHSGTAVANHVFTPPTIAWPAGMPTFAGTPSTCVVNHVHVQNVNSATTGGLSGYTPDTSTNTSTASGYSTANPTGGAASCTPAGSIAWPAGVPVNSGGSVDAHAVTQPAAHTVTQPSDHSYTPAGTVAAPAFTGTPFDNRPAFVRVIFCQKS